MYGFFHRVMHLPLHTAMDTASGWNFFTAKTLSIVICNLKAFLCVTRHYTEHLDCTFRTSWTRYPFTNKLTTSYAPRLPGISVMHLQLLLVCRALRPGLCCSVRVPAGSHSGTPEGGGCRDPQPTQ